MSKPCKPFCDCRGCECSTCPNAFSKLAIKESSDYICDHGSRPECGCTRNRPKKGNLVSQTCILDEPEPILDPKRTESIMKVLKYDKSCNCKVVTRALRADVHRYLGLLDRNREYPQSHPPEDPEENEDSRA